MKILIKCETMAYLSGSPLYNYELAMELSKEHDVYIYSNWNHPTMWDRDNCQIMFTNLAMAGINIIDNLNDVYDLAIISQMKDDRVKAKRIINVVHSEYDCETPYYTADEWVAIRPSIKEHLEKYHNIPSNKIRVIYNGIDLERFKPTDVIDKKCRVVIPCTLDPLREKFLNWYIDRASDDFNVELYGFDCGAKLHTSPFVTIHKPIFNIEKVMSGADLVAGILLGRVNLEARAMKILSRIHNPDNPDEYEEYYPPQREFEPLHDIKIIAKQIIKKI